MDVTDLSPEFQATIATRCLAFSLTYAIVSNAYYEEDVCA